MLIDLPNELIYSIFNKLDLKSLINLSLTCQHLFNCRRIYSNYFINLENKSKNEFDSICRIIDFNEINSLILSENHRSPGQIEYFCENYLNKDLNRLKSLKLIEINENNLEQMLKHLLNNFNLQTIEITFREYFQILNCQSKILLYQVFSLATLRKIVFDLKIYQNQSISWPKSNKIEEFSLLNLNLNQLIEIIRNSSKMKSLRLKNIEMKDFKIDSLNFLCLKEIQRFEIEESEFFFSNIECLLLSMVNVQFIRLDVFTNSIENIFQNNQFNEFFRTNFTRLKQFEFFIHFHRMYSNSFDLFCKQTRRSSSIEYYLNKHSNEMYFYSIPLIHHHFNYLDLPLTSPTFDFVQSLHLNPKDLKNSLGKEIKLANVKSLKLTIDEQCSFDSISKLICKDKLNELSLIINSRSSYLNSTLNQFLIFQKEFVHLESIEIFNRWHSIFSYVNINLFCSFLGKQIEHLNIDICHSNQILLLIEQLRSIKSFKFKYSFDKSTQIESILNYLQRENVSFTSIVDIHYLALWISQSNQNKRIKID